MSSWQRQQDELSALTSIFRADELSVRDDGGVFRANVRTPPSLVVTGTGGTRDALTHLPPLSLHFTLPPGYPDKEPPSFMLAAHWLSGGRLSHLCRRLDELFAPGSEALFSWFSFLQDETWTFLCLSETLSVARLQRPMAAGDARRAGQSANSNPDGSLHINQSRHSKPDGSLHIDQSRHSKPDGSLHIDQSRHGKPDGSLHIDQSRHGKPDGSLNIDQSRHGKPDGSLHIDQSAESGSSGFSVSVSVVDLVRQDSEPSGGGREETRDGEHSEGCEKTNDFVNPKDRDDPEDCEKAEGSDDPEGVVDARAVVESVPSLRDHLIAHAQAQACAEFDRSAQECAVCLTVWTGAQSVLFAPCQHVVCCECSARYLRQAALRGAAVTCPGSECAAPFPHHTARRLLSEAEFLSYDARLLESALSALTDIVRCPRAACQYAVTRDPADGKLATCFSCRYAFCADCRQGYHGVEPCRFRPDEQQRLISEYREGSAQERAALEKRFGRRRLEALLESALTQTWLADNSKPCPHCKAGIQKALGCNKMVCWRCNTHFCWLCSTQLDPQVPYAHYLSSKSPCHRLLFQGTFPDAEDEDNGNLHVEGDDEYIEDLDRPVIDM